MNDGPIIDDEALIRARDGGTLPAQPGPDAVLRLAEWDRQDALVKVLYDPVADEPVPEAMRASVDQARGALAFPWARIAAAFVLVAVGAAGGFLAGRVGSTAPTRIATEAIRAHETFAVEVRHPVEVPASDEAHLTAWLSKRLGHAITPPDFAGQGFHLIGGRVLPESAGTAAFMMYEDETGRRLSLYVTKDAATRETAFRFVEDGETHGFWWVDGGLGCVIVGDLPRDTLRAIATAAYDQLI